MDRTKYQDDYYKDNKKRLSDAKKAKYRRDSTYNSKAKERARIQSAIDSVARQREVLTVTHAGQKEITFKLGYLAGIINRERTVIYYWRKKGIIPIALHFDDKGRPLYSFSQVSFVKALIDEVDTTMLHLTYQDISIILKEIWDKSFSMEELMLQIRSINGREDNSK